MAAARRRQLTGVKRIGLAKTPERVPWLGEGVEPRRREWQNVEAEGVSRVRLGLRDPLTARPHLGGVGLTGDGRAELALAVDDRSPHARAGEQTAGISADSWRVYQKLCELVARRQPITIRLARRCLS